MSMFIAERYGSHMLFWAIMAVLTLDGYLLHQFNITQATDNTALAIAITSTVVITLILLTVIAFSSSLMSILFFMLMPLAYLSTKVEAWLRIRLDMPYAPSHEADLDTTWRHTYSSHDRNSYMSDDNIEDLYPKRTRRQRKNRYRSSSQNYNVNNGNSDRDRSMDILVAFTLSAWIGSAWGDDDGE